METQKRSKFLKTHQDWHPTLQDGTFRLSLLKLRNGWRVCAWGNDDFGFERDFPNFSEAFDLWNSLGDWTTQEWFRANGFQRA